MSLSKYFDPKKTTELFGLHKKFDYFANLINTNKLPNISLLSGPQGVGKSTFVNHLMHFTFDNENYDLKLYKLNKKSFFYNQLNQNIFQNIIYLNGSNFRTIKIDDIRDLKKKILTTSLKNNKRFIILDDVDLFNLNSMNALLKILEEPSKNNFFFLIDNRRQPLLETIKSRCIEFKFILNDNLNNQVIENLLEKFQITKTIDKNLVRVSPGNFIKYNFIINEKKINFDDKFLQSLETILNIYKKERDIYYKDFIIFFIEYYFKLQKNKNIYSSTKYFQYRSFTLNNINQFFLYNLNQKSLVNSLETKLINE